jgi:hypothetical protein
VYVCVVAAGVWVSDTVIFTILTCISFFAMGLALVLIAGLTGPSGQTAQITIFGTSFGTGKEGSPTVSLSGNNCPVTFSNHSVIVCTSPVGNGASKQVIVTVASQQSTNFRLFSYTAPTLLSLSPTTAPTVGGSLLTLTGTSLGVSDIVITVGGLPCPRDTATSHTQVTCVLPAGQGVNVPVILTTASLPSNRLNFNYSAPVVLSVVPLGGTWTRGRGATVLFWFRLFLFLFLFCFCFCFVF